MDVSIDFIAYRHGRRNYPEISCQPNFKVSVQIEGATLPSLGVSRSETLHVVFGFKSAMSADLLINACEERDDYNSSQKAHSRQSAFDGSNMVGGNPWYMHASYGQSAVCGTRSFSISVLVGW